MLIRKGSLSSKAPASQKVVAAGGTQARPSSSGRGGPGEMGEEERLELLLSRYEKNLELEAFYIRKKDIPSLLDILPAQGSLIEGLTNMLETIKLEAAAAKVLDARLGAADAKREENKKAFEEILQAVRGELDEMNLARQRLKQARALAKSNYADPEPSRMESWA